MWVEDDLGPGVPCLQSWSEPEEGRVYRMYHGTSAQAAAQIMISGFKQSADGMLGRGVYLSRDLNKASRYPLDLPENQRVVIRVKVNVGKVKKIDYQGHPLQKTWHDHGYDTAWCPPGCGMVRSGLEEDCVWDPTRIKFIDIIPRSPQDQTVLKPEDGMLGHMYRMYHGTSAQAAAQIMINGFRQSTHGTLGRGVYLSRDLNKASRYPSDLPENQRVVIRVKVNVGKVKKIFYQGNPLQKTWHYHGYDTAWCTPGCGMVQSGLEEDCVWDPRRIHVIDIIPCNLIAYTKYTSGNITMWVEDDLGPGVPCLQSWSEPEEGRVYRMYHGTSVQAAAQIMISGFKQSADGMLGRGVYLSRDLDKASRYPLDLPENQRVVIRVKVNVGKVKKIDYQGHPLQKTWHDHGYDTAWCPPGCGMVRSGLEEDSVWDPRRIHVIDIIPPFLQESYHQEPTNGKVYRMYHGTSQLAAANIMKYGFQQSATGMLGPGVYLSRDLNKASRYPLHLPEHQRVVIRVKVNVGRVKKIDRQGHPMQKTWHRNGYDTAWCPPQCGMVPSGLEEDCVWDPKRIEIIDAIRPRTTSGQFYDC
ncbi:grass carp reovirus (GCRV)-induced gene 2e [Clarias gariepinus]|uniref:grass carp reovirus (GCRV)-induced gene 2e n=1 Tax=Clarias gariepinus TaxID=13013 RepID=UPI00234DE6E6|nr:grass carp reovirus (GCRV)-induced gene 2e [Clarias gariepinus]